MQILRLVKATFPDMSFDDQSILRDCSSDSSSLEKLRCQWTEAIELAGSDGQGANAMNLHDHRLLALMQVNIAGAFSIFLPQLSFLVPANGTTNDEPHRQQL